VNRKQSAVIFLNQALKHLRKGDQFAFVLPKSFLTGGVLYDWLNVRQSIGDCCHILETWQLPEGVIGLKARQQTCVVSGIVGERKTYTLARAIVPGKQLDLIREQGFLGQAWIGKVNSAQWHSVTAPALSVADTIPLGELFSAHIGVTLKPGEPPISNPNGNLPTKRFWKYVWQQHGFWIDPERAPVKERYIRYGKAYLKSHQPNDESVYDSPKLLVKRSTNLNAKKPIDAYYDSYGLCPTSDMYCIIPISGDAGDGQSVEFKAVWRSLTDTERMFWLLGILKSDMAINLSMINRDGRHVNKDNWLNLPLPAVIRVVLESEW
jgi:hypothetical protein